MLISNDRVTLDYIRATSELHLNSYQTFDRVTSGRPFGDVRLRDLNNVVVMDSL